MKTIPAVFRRRLALRAHYQQARHDWLATNAARYVRELLEDVYLLQGFRDATRLDIKLLKRQVRDMADMPGLRPGVKPTAGERA